MRDFEIQKSAYGTSLNYRRGSEVFSQKELHNEWLDNMDKQFNAILEKQDNASLSKDDLSEIFAINSDTYVSSELNKYLTNLKDLNGNNIDFNSLDIHHQQQIVQFLQLPLEETNIYGTRASLSDIRVDLNGSSLYIEANLHSIDGKTFSMGANFAPTEEVNYKSYQRDDMRMMFEDRTDWQTLFVSGYTQVKEKPF